MRNRTLGAMALASAVAMLAAPALAQGQPGGYGGMRGQGPGMMMGQGYGPMAGHPCMMGQGMMGQGMMNPGMMNPGTMGPGMMGPGMMGRGMGPGMMERGPGAMMGHGGLAPLPEDLTVDHVRHMMGHRVAMSGNPNLAVGDIVEQDADTITAEVVTKDGSLVMRYAFDRHTGAMRPAASGE